MEGNSVFDRAQSRTYDTRPMSRPPAEATAPATPLVVDAMVLGHGGLIWEREFTDTRFERLVDVAVSAVPMVSVKLTFAMLDKRPIIHGEMYAKVELVCQRCMSSMQYPAVETFDLMLVDNEAELALVPESHEPWIANASRLNVLELVEEQLLLALPLIAKHADARDCVDFNPTLAVAAESPQTQAASVVAPVAGNAEVQRPFGNLRDLLRKQ